MKRITQTCACVALAHPVRLCSTTSGANSGTSTSNGDASSSSPNTPTLSQKQQQARTEAQIKEDIIKALISKDKEIFELKRLHELSMLRVEQLQNRILKDQEDRGIYYEQNSNVHTFDTISVGQYTQRNTLHHMMGLEKLRNFKIYCAISASIYTCLFLYYRYIINPDMAYVEVPIAVIGDTRKMLNNYYAQLREKEYKEDMEKWKQ